VRLEGLLEAVYSLVPGFQGSPSSFSTNGENAGLAPKGGASNDEKRYVKCNPTRNVIKNFTRKFPKFKFPTETLFSIVSVK
jgi:hypothetical protein